jgi:hypothetical protein
VAAEASTLAAVADALEAAAAAAVADALGAAADVAASGGGAAAAVYRGARASSARSTWARCADLQRCRERGGLARFFLNEAPATGVALARLQRSSVTYAGSRSQWPYPSKFLAGCGHAEARGVSRAGRYGKVGG